MYKTIAAGMLALLVSGSSLAYAQQSSTEAPRDSWKPSEADFEALTDARIAALKAGLQLSAEQAKDWPAVEQAIRNMAKQRRDRMAAHRNDQHRGDAIERLRERADAMTDRAAQLRKLADAAQPLYTSLNDDQKHRLHLLMRMLRPHHAHFAEWGEHHGHHSGQE